MSGMQARTASTCTRPDGRPDVKWPILSLYSIHLVLLSAVNISLLSLWTLQSGMGLWIFGHGNNGTSHWEPDPSDKRGTWTILSTCIITLTLCVYTSLHLNIPAHKTSLKATFGMKAKYVIFGLLAPELIVFNAWRQRTIASSIVTRLRKDRGRKQISSVFRKLYNGLKGLPCKVSRCFKRISGKMDQVPTKDGLPFVADKDPWAETTLVHAFYIVMGGYAFDVSKDPEPRIWPRGVDRLTPNVMTVMNCLLSQEKDLRTLLPFLSEAEIWDKSKANGLAKAIVCIQAAWFCTQCVARLGQGMPISLLELNTFAHAICALLVYVLWWSKPLDVQVPSVIDVGQSEVARNVCALAWSGPQAPVSHLRRVRPIGDGIWNKVRDGLWLVLQGSTHSHLGDGPLVKSSPGQVSSTKCLPCAQIHELRRPLALEKRPSQFQGLTTDERDSRVWISTKPPVFTLAGSDNITSTSFSVSSDWDSIDVDEILLERLKVVERLRAQPDYTAYDAAFSRILKATDPDLCMLKPRELNFTDSLMRQNSDVSSVGRNIIGASGIILSGLLYGGLHMIAWGSTAFKSPFEDLAWKVSCFIVAGGGFFAFAGIFGLDMATKRIDANQPIDVFKYLVYISGPFYGAFTALYLVCRVYLVFEVFRNLAYLDPQVYQTPDVSRNSLLLHVELDKMVP